MYVHAENTVTLSVHAHDLYIHVPDRGQSQVIQSLRRAKFIVPHWRERERERERERKQVSWTAVRKFQTQ